MKGKMFKALVAEESSEGIYSRHIRERSVVSLPDGALLVEVRYSSLNYKDALSATGNKGVTRSYPHTPGVDAAGVVAECSDGTFSPGDQVIVTGHDLGMNTPGGFGQYIRVPSDWGVALPGGLTLKESMALGTAGFTAAYSVLKLERAGVKPASGDILVTGASGGVGSIAVAILAGAGYRVFAATGKAGAGEFLRGLGATGILTRKEIQDSSGRPLLKGRWAAAVDVAGGATLSSVLRAIRYGGVVTCCGLTDSPELNLTVFPFILRGVSLMGVDSAECGMDTRREIWSRLASDWKPARLRDMYSECSLYELEGKVTAMLKGEITGRTVVNLETE